MSTTCEVTVWCDADDCFEWTFGDGNNSTARGARAGAKAEGWVYRKGQDFCPFHTDHDRPRPGGK